MLVTIQINELELELLFYLRCIQFP